MDVYRLMLFVTIPVNLAQPILWVAMKSNVYMEKFVFVVIEIHLELGE